MDQKEAMDYNSCPWCKEVNYQVIDKLFICNACRVSSDLEIRNKLICKQTWQKWPENRPSSKIGTGFIEICLEYNNTKMYRFGPADLIEEWEEMGRHGEYDEYKILAWKYVFPYEGDKSRR